jgi:GGDEF domain-containing protein
VDYARFERLIIGVGAAAIVATAALSLTPRPDVVELIAQLLLLAVLVGAVQWGRRGGTTAAVVAIVAYTVLRVPAIAVSGLTGDVLRLLGLHAALYGLVGIAGGEACTRIRHALATMQDAAAIDEASSVYTPRFVGRRLQTAIASFHRYGVGFSVIVLTVRDRSLAGRLSITDEAQIHAIATRMRGELRLVDEIGRLPRGAFVVIMPNTKLAGAGIVAARLEGVLRDSLGIPEGDFETRALSTLDDIHAIEELAEESVAAAQADD